MLAWILNNWLLLIGIASPAVVALLVWCYHHQIGLYSLKMGPAGSELSFGGDKQQEKSERKRYDRYYGEQLGLYKLQEKPEWYEVLQEELNRLPVGKVVFNPPDTMKLGVRERVETRISRDVNADLMTSLRGRGLPQIEELKISELMKVRLSGHDFDIVSLNEEEQIIEAIGFTEIRGQIRF